MMNIISFQADSLQNLDKKLRTLSNTLNQDNQDKPTIIDSEYVQVDNQLEGLWIQITSSQSFALSKLPHTNSLESICLHLIHSDNQSHYKNGQPHTQTVKQSILTIPSHQPYQLSLHLPYQGEWLLLNFSATWCKENLPPTMLPNGIKCYWHPIYSYYFNEISKITNKANPAEKLTRKSLLSQLIYQTALDLIQANTKWDDYIGVYKIKNHLMTNLHLPFPSLKALADMGRMSVSQLKNKFRQSEQSSPEQFFIDKRMNVALEYLAKGMSVKETAFLLGYSHPSNFINAFKRKFGQVPSEYKKLLQSH